MLIHFESSSLRRKSKIKPLPASPPDIASHAYTIHVLILSDHLILRFTGFG